MGIPDIVNIFTSWDAPRHPDDCFHCHGTELAPGDGRTKCGFCDRKVQRRR